MHSGLHTQGMLGMLMAGVVPPDENVPRSLGDS